MSELCETHKIVAAPDGRCVLCRRPKLALLSEQEESPASRALTVGLGLGLLATMALTAYAMSQPSESMAGARRTRGLSPQASANLTRQSADAGDSARADESSAGPAPPSMPIAAEPPSPEPAQPMRVTTEAATAEQAHAKPSPSKRPRAWSARGVDPRLVEARKRVRVTMYSAPWCTICDRARAFLQARQVQLVEHDVDVDTQADKRLTQLNPSGSIPTLVVEGQVIVGFHPWGLQDALDAAAQEHYCAQSGQAAVCERLAGTR